MSDLETKLENQDASAQESAPNDQYIDLSDFEKEQLQKGWRPKEEFDVDPKNKGKSWKTAEQFEYDGRFFEKIDSQNRFIRSQEQALRMQAKELREMKELVTTLSTNQLKGLEHNVHATINRLQLDDDEAVKQGDLNRHREIQAQMLQETKKLNTINQAPIQQPTRQIELSEDERVASNEFIARNSNWFNKNSEENTKMAELALQQAAAIQTSRPDLTPKEQMDLVEKTVRTVFPHKFTEDRRSEPSAVTPKSVVGVTSTEDDIIRNLTVAQRNIGKELVKRGLYKSLGEYAKTVNIRRV